MTTLLLRFAGPLHGYGTSQSLEKIRDTALEPTKSAVLGAVCAALGKDRESDGADGLPTLRELSSLKMGVRVDKEGTPTADYQIAGCVEGTRTADGGRNIQAFFTKLFLADASFLVALEGPGPLLHRISEAFLKPRWAPRFGRRGCVPSEPITLKDGGVRELDLVSALKSIPIKHPTRFVVEVPVGQGTTRVCDVPLSFATNGRQFAMREVKIWMEATNVSK